MTVPAAQPSPAPAAPAKKPLWTRRWFVILAIIVVVVAISRMTGGGSKSATTSSTLTTTVTSEAPATAEPATEAAPAVAAITDEEACAEFQAFVDERAAAGVMIAKTVTSITCADGVVTAVFDPASTGMDQATFDTINAFPNLAKFIGSPMSFSDEQGDRLRTRVTRVDTIMADGTPAGSMTAAELYKVGTGKDLDG